MNRSQIDLVPILKQVIEKRVIKEEPSVGIYGWICIMKTIHHEKGESYYKIGRTGSLEAYIAKQKTRSYAFKRKSYIGFKNMGWCNIFL